MSNEFTLSDKRAITGLETEFEALVNGQVFTLKVYAATPRAAAEIVSAYCDPGDLIDIFHLDDPAGFFIVTSTAARRAGHDQVEQLEW